MSLPRSLPEPQYLRARAPARLADRPRRRRDRGRSASRAGARARRYCGSGSDRGRDMSTTTTDRQTLDELCVNTIRTLSMDAVQKANSGHPGTPMALAPLAYVLYTRVLRHNPRNAEWPNRDRFVLSAGHASMLLYSCLLYTSPSPRDGLLSR